MSEVCQSRLYVHADYPLAHGIAKQNVSEVFTVMIRQPAFAS